MLVYARLLVGDTVFTNTTGKVAKGYCCISKLRKVLGKVYSTAMIGLDI